MSIILQPKSVAYANGQLGKKLDSAFTKIEQDADHIRLIAARQEFGKRIFLEQMV